MTNEGITIAVAVNDRTVLQNNLLRSPGLLDGGNREILIKEGFKSASLAYNSAIDEASNDLIVFLHQDIYLPGSWWTCLRHALAYLASSDPSWGVLGCFGSTRAAYGGLGRVYTNGLGFHGRELACPEPVETLDEIVLVLRRSSGLRFDVMLPHYHWYGTDICLTARMAGRASYAFQGLCVHNTNQLLHLPKEFYLGYRYIKRKWARHLPIAAACMTVSHFNDALYRRRLREVLESTLRMTRCPVPRAGDPAGLLGSTEAGANPI